MKRLMLLALLLPGAAPAQTDVSPEWTAEKCARYTRAWQHVSAGDGLAGIGRDFLTAHAEFLASGCTLRGTACPRSAAELRLADTLALMAVAEGTAGSFLPFRCSAD